MAILAKHEVFNMNLIIPIINRKDVTSCVRTSPNSSNLPHRSSMASLDTFYSIDLPKSFQSFGRIVIDEHDLLDYMELI